MYYFAFLFIQNSFTISQELRWNETLLKLLKPEDYQSRAAKEKIEVLASLQLFYINLQADFYFLYYSEKRIKDSKTKKKNLNIGVLESALSMIVRRVYRDFPTTSILDQLKKFQHGNCEELTRREFLNKKIFNHFKELLKAPVMFVNGSMGLKPALKSSRRKLNKLAMDESVRNALHKGLDALEFLVTGEYGTEEDLEKLSNAIKESIC